MKKIIEILLLSMVVLIVGCGESDQGKTQEETKMANEKFWEYKYKETPEDAEKNSLYKACYEKNVKSVKEIRQESEKISGTDTISKKQFKTAFKKLSDLNDEEKEKCKKIKARKN